MIKKRLKFQYLILFIGLFVILPVLTVSQLVSSNLKEEKTTEPDMVADEIISPPKPVINVTTKVIPPYVDQSVKVGKKYYDYKASEEEQINSIVKHDNTYMQNAGIDYVGEKEFEVVAILNGTVTNVESDETNKKIEIKHDDGKVSVYQSLGEIKVKKGDIINQGQVIGTSGTNEIDKELGNHLHFEIYDNGGNINPENYLNTEISLKKEN